MSRTIEQILKSLPDPNKQLDRVFRVHSFHCPNCRALSPARYQYVPTKRVELCDIVIECETCGESCIERNLSRGTEVWRIAGTDFVYDQGNFYDETKDIMDGADPKDIFFYSKVCEDHANTLMVLNDNHRDSCFHPYLKEMSAFLEHLKTRGTKDLEFICERTFECNSIAKYDLLVVMREIYHIAMMNKDDIPEGLWLAIELEKEILDYAFDNMFYDSDKDHTEPVEWIAEDFEKLPKEERMSHPFVAVNVYKYLMKFHQRRGSSDRVLNGVAKSLIDAAKNARAMGAPIDRTAMYDHLMAYMHLLATQKTAHKKAMADCSVWDDDPFYKGVASVVYADALFRGAKGDEPSLPLDHLDPKVAKEILHHSEVAIECLESLSDLSGIEVWLPLAYFYNGYAGNDVSKMKLALDYLEFFDLANMATLSETNYVVDLIALHAKFGSALQRSALKLRGYPIF